MSLEGKKQGEKHSGNSRLFLCSHESCGVFYEELPKLCRRAAYLQTGILHKARAKEVPHHMAENVRG